MSSDEADKKSVEEDKKEVSSSEENEEKDNVKEEKASKPAPKKKGADPPKIKQPAKKRVKTEQAEKETKKEEKKEEKKKAEQDEDDESAEENDVENHKAVPLLDQPLEISGSRRRKEVARFSFKEPEAENKEVKIPEGKGTPLGEIEWIEHNIQRFKPEDLKLLHRICFGKLTKAALVKKNLRKFNGFEFEEASDDYEKKKVQFGTSNKKVLLTHLKNICHILDLEKSGTKDEIVDRILSFLTCPVDSGKKVGTGRSKRKGASVKNYDEGDDTYKSKKKSKGKKKSEDSEESEKEKSDDEVENDEEKDDVKTNNKKKNNVQSDDDQEDEKKEVETIDEEEEEEEEEEEKPKKAAKKKPTKKAAAEVATKKAPPKKRAAAKKAAEKKVESEEEEEANGEEEEDTEEPAVKKTKTPPTDEEIKAYVKSLLEGANLELVTMKKVCQDVYAHYPDYDLGHKKAFIKTTVKALISS